MEIKIANPMAMQRAIEYIKKQNYDRPVVVTVRRWSEKKTLPQLRTIHLWIHEARTFFGETRGKYFTDEELKDWVKSLFGLVEIYETPNGKRKRYKSFADYTLEEMRKLMDDFQNYCATEFQLFLTTPDMPEE